MPSRHRPSIFRIGHVHDDGQTITVSGWGLGVCSAQCRCHRHPITSQLVIATSDVGDLGLATFRTDGRRCDCCQPWSPDELAAILRDLADVAALPEPAA